MRPLPSPFIRIALVTLACAALSACGDDRDFANTSTASSTGGGGAGGEGGSGGGGIGGGLSDCLEGASCGVDGVCIAGACCDAAQACGSTCCGGADACLFGACVTPGASCRSQHDCASSQYCETALGDNEDAPDPGPACAAAPLEGHCLDLPEVCVSGSSPAGCVEACEYHPPIVATLDAGAKWHWGTDASEAPEYVDIWSSPTVGRIHDANCDGKVDELDPPNVVFVAGRNLDGSGVPTICSAVETGSPVACQTGVLRMLNGATGKEVWTLAKAHDEVGFAGIATAIGDIDADGRIDIVAATGDGHLVLVNGDGKITRTSDLPIPNIGDLASYTGGAFGWGGGLAIADIDGDGFPEIAYGNSVFTTKDGKISLAWTGTGGFGQGTHRAALSTFVDLDGAADGHLELLAGNTAYTSSGSMLWDRSVDGPAGPALTDGFPAVGDFDGDHKPDVVLVSENNLWLLDSVTGATTLGPFALPSDTIPAESFGGPPTVADFDGDGRPEIGIATKNYYSVAKPDFIGGAFELLWKTPNLDRSNVTGSSVFDFEGDGRAEVVYADECFLWVYDGKTGKVRFGASHTSFTTNEAPVIADVDGDGRAEVLAISNGVTRCRDTDGVPLTMNGYTWEPGPGVSESYRGVTLFGGKAGSWVGTRTLWNQQAYHVTNICDDRDSACDAPNVYGSIPKREKRNIDLPWLNNFRQNAQDKGQFNAPDATVALLVACDGEAQVSVQNAGLSSLPAGVRVGVYRQDAAAADPPLATTETTHTLYAGQTEALTVELGAAVKGVGFVARVLIDADAPAFRECREDNNASAVATATCIQ